MGLSDLLNGGGTYLKWETPGTTYTGVITEVTTRQARKFESTDLDYWDDGTAKMQAVITLATDYRDGSNPDDDGTRSLSINLWSGQKKSLIAACKAAGVDEPKVGMTFTASHVSGIGNAKAPRVFEYILGAGPSGIALQLGGESLVDTVAKVNIEAPANPAETAKSLLAAGMSATDVANATGLPANTVAALANLVA